VAAGAQMHRAKFLIDAGGRGGALLGKRLPVGPATIALTTIWQQAELPPGTMLVEAMADGWCWGASAASGEMHTAVFRDAAGRPANPADLLRDTALFAGPLRAAKILRTAVTDATPRQAHDPAGKAWLRIGDAAFAPDPLSSQGLAMALRAGLQAAAVTHTILSGRDPEAALAFHRSSVADTAAHHAKTIARLYATPGNTPFWQARRRREPLAAPLHPNARLALAPQLVIGEMPALVGDHVEIVRAVKPASGRAIAWISGIPAATLLGGWCNSYKAADVLQSWSRFFPPAQAQAIVEKLIEDEILVFEEKIGGDEAVPPKPPGI
jgi:hypothetical protein